MFGIPTDPSEKFAETDYGTNGFWLDFQNSNLGLDASSMGNDWSVTGSPTQTADTPTDDADDNIGNYAIMNLLDVYLNANNGSNTFSNGNKTYNQFNTGSNDAFSYNYRRDPAVNGIGNYLLTLLKVVIR